MKMKHLVNVGKNKANSNPIPEKPKTNVSEVLTKGYDNKSHFVAIEKQTQLTRQWQIWIILSRSREAHSFDPYLACSVHMLKPGKDKPEVVVQTQPSI